MVVLEILVALEKKYKIIIPEDKLKDMTTLNKIVELVKSAKKRCETSQDKPVQKLILKQSSMKHDDLPLIYGGVESWGQGGGK